MIHKLASRQFGGGVCVCFVLFNKFRIDPFCSVLRISPRRPFSSGAKASPAVWSSSKLAGVGFPGLHLSDGEGCLGRF